MNIFLLSFLSVSLDLLINIISINKIGITDFWTFKLLFVYFIGKKMFNIRIYKHQLFSIYFISIACSSLLFISFIFSILKTENISNKEIYFIFIGIIGCLFNLLIDSFINWKLKWLMDLKYISISKLYMYYGIFGFVIYSIICTISTFFNCGNDILELCDVEKNGKKYFESFTIFLDNFSTSYIFLIILHVITANLTGFFYFLIIKNLTPFHIVSLPTIYYLILQIILGIYLFAKDNNKFKENIWMILLDLLTYFLAFLAFSIFLEFIELNFCLCNYNLRKYIVQRSELESSDNEINDSMISEQEEKEIEKSYDS